MVPKATRIMAVAVRVRANMTRVVSCREINVKKGISLEERNHLEEHKEGWKEDEICDGRAKSPGCGNVSIVNHAQPVLQPM